VNRDEFEDQFKGAPDPRLARVSPASRPRLARVIGWAMALAALIFAALVLVP
jgi:hypothetical protein